MAHLFMFKRNFTMKKRTCSFEEKLFWFLVLASMTLSLSLITIQNLRGMIIAHYLLFLMCIIFHDIPIAIIAQTACCTCPAIEWRHAHLVFRPNPAVVTCIDLV